MKLMKQPRITTKFQYNYTRSQRIDRKAEDLTALEQHSHCSEFDCTYRDVEVGGAYAGLDCVVEEDVSDVAGAEVGHEGGEDEREDGDHHCATHHWSHHHCAAAGNEGERGEGRIGGEEGDGRGRRGEG